MAREQQLRALAEFVRDPTTLALLRGRPGNTLLCKLRTMATVATDNNARMFYDFVRRGNFSEEQLPVLGELDSLVAGPGAEPNVSTSSGSRTRPDLLTSSASQDPHAAASGLEEHQQKDDTEEKSNHKKEHFMREEEPTDGDGTAASATPARDPATPDAPRDGGDASEAEDEEMGAPWRKDVEAVLRHYDEKGVFVVDKLRAIASAVKASSCSIGAVVASGSSETEPNVSASSGSRTRSDSYVAALGRSTETPVTPSPTSTPRVVLKVIEPLWATDVADGNKFFECVANKTRWGNRFKDVDTGDLFIVVVKGTLQVAAVAKVAAAPQVQAEAALLWRKVLPERRAALDAYLAKAESIDFLEFDKVFDARGANITARVLLGRIGLACGAKFNWQAVAKWQDVNAHTKLTELIEVWPSSVR